MRKQRQAFGRVLLLMFALAVPLGAAQVSGTWTLRALANSGEAELKLSSSRPGHNNFEASQTLGLRELRGLGAEQVESTAGTLVHFALRRAVGTLHFDGYLKQGQGAGAFVFDPDPTYIPAMQAAGISDVSENQLLPMAVYDIAPAYVRELRAAGVEVSLSRDLIALRIFNVTPQYIGQLRALGYSVPPPRELVKLRIFKVDPAEIQGFRKAGYNPTIDQLVRASMFHVTPEFATQLTQLGYGHVSIGEMVRLRMFHVTAGYVRSVQSHGLTHLTLDQLLKLRMYGID